MAAAVSGAVKIPGSPGVGASAGSPQPPNTLPTTELAAGDPPCRLDDAGRPIWPLTDPHQRAALGHLAHLFGATLEDVEGQPGKGSPTVDEEVLALTPRFAAEAELYAHLTGRRPAGVAPFEELSPENLPAILLVDREAVDQALVELLYAATLEGRASGLLVAGSEEEMRRQVLLRSAASMLPPTAPRLHRAHVWPLTPFGHEVLPDYHLAGGQAPAEAVRGTLSAGAGALHIHTHSDGVDAQLPSGLVLCPLLDLPEFPSPLGTEAPACQLNGYCHRLERPLPGALGDAGIVRPGEISARALVLDTCWGLGPAFGLVGARWAMSGPLLDRGTVGAILTTFEISLTRPMTALPLVDRLVSGEALGEALVGFVREGDEQGQRVRFCLLGDPAMRIAKPEGPPARPLFAGVAFPTPPLPPPPPNFLQAHLLISRQGAPELAGEALTALEEWQLAAWTGRPTEEPPGAEGPAPGAAWRRAMLTYLLARGSAPSKSWIHLSQQIIPLNDLPPCPSCGRKTSGHLVRLRTLGPDRRLRNCPRCGQIEDAPAFLLAALRVDGEGVLHLDGELPSDEWPPRPWAGGLLLDPPHRELRRAWPWPADFEGRPERRFALPEAWPPGPSRAALMLLFDHDTLLVLAVAHRRQGPA